MKSVISVNIEVNDLWPTWHDREYQRRALDKINEREIGEFVGFGGGAGDMEFKYEVDAKAATAAVRVIKDIVAGEFPGRTFSVELASDDVYKSLGIAKADGKQQDCSLLAFLPSDGRRSYSKSESEECIGNVFVTEAEEGTRIGVVVSSYLDRDKAGYVLRTEYKAIDGSELKEGSLEQTDLARVINVWIREGWLADRVVEELQTNEKLSAHLLHDLQFEVYRIQELQIKKSKSRGFGR